MTRRHSVELIGYQRSSMIKRICTVLITNDQLLLAFFNNSVRYNIEKLEKHLLKEKKNKKEKKETAIQYLPRFPVNVRAKFPRISYFKIRSRS